MANALRNNVGLALRKAGLLTPAYWGLYVGNYVRTLPANQRFRAEHPGIPLPPTELLFQTSLTCDLANYYNGGRERAAAFVELFERLLPAGPLRICDWGCGPARVTRHLPDISNRIEAHGTDYNPKTIRWCQENIRGVQFKVNQLGPPLPYEADSFDALFSFSVYTHLAADLQMRWLAENIRVVRSGGVVILTMHGDAFRGHLTEGELAAYDGAGVVERAGVKGGASFFTIYNSPWWVQDTFLAGYEVVHRELKTDTSQPRQDVWVIRV